MKPSFKALAAALSLIVAGAIYPANAQAPSKSDRLPGAEGTPELPASSTTKERLDNLFALLKSAESPAAAKRIEARIWSAWLESGSDTVDLLISRATQAIGSGDHQLALQLLNSAIELDPDNPESWNKRATLYYVMKNYGESLGDIQRTLALEPRHFGAMSGLGAIFRILGDDKSALEIYRRALDVYPQLKGARDAVEELAEEVEGRGI